MSVDYSRLYGKNVVVIECSESTPSHKGRVGIASESCGSYIDEVSKPHNVTVTFYADEYGNRRSCCATTVELAPGELSDKKKRSEVEN